MITGRYLRLKLDTEVNCPDGTRKMLPAGTTVMCLGEAQIPVLHGSTLCYLYPGDGKLVPPSDSWDATGILASEVGLDQETADEAMLGKGFFATLRVNAHPIPQRCDGFDEIVLEKGTTVYCRGPSIEAQGGGQPTIYSTRKVVVVRNGREHDVFRHQLKKIDLDVFDNPTRKT